MAKRISRASKGLPAWSPLAVVLVMTVGTTALVGLFHFIIRIATA
jgi:hypothetical protein